MLFDSWIAEEETDWGLHGQPLMRESSSSLPIHLQPAPLQGLTRKGSASLPLFWEGSDALPAQSSSLQLMPGGTLLLSANVKRDRPASRITSMLDCQVMKCTVFLHLRRALQASADPWGGVRAGAACAPRAQLGSAGLMPGGALNAVANAEPNR